MKRICAWLLTALIILPFAGCDQKALIRRFTPEAEDKMARELINDLKRGDVSAAAKLISPELKQADVESGLRELVNIFQAGEIKNIEVIGVNTFSNLGGKKTVTLTYEIEMSSGWLAGTVVILEEQGNCSVTTARFNKNTDSLEHLNRFTLVGKGPLHFVFLGLAIVIPFFSIVSLVVCARTRLKRKWVWVVFILLGLVTVRLNWTTGEMDYQLVSFQLLGAGVFKSGLAAPWIIGISLPVGAIVFLLNRKKLISEESSAAPSTMAPLSQG